jgi:hypothetical protein
MGLASLALNIGVFCDFLYNILLFKAILGLDFLRLALSRRRFEHTAFDEFLFATGDGQAWLIAERAQVQEVFGGPSDREILMSSTSPTRYTAQWYHRAAQSEDPWISLTDHGDAIGEGNMLYGEASFGGAHAANVLPAHNGANRHAR